jgi:hypothetical protein
MKIWAAMGLVAAVTACGSGDGGGGGQGGGFPPGTTCGLSMSVSGGIERTIPVAESLACGTSLAFDSGISFGYIPIDDGPVEAILLQVDELERDETGAGFPTTVTIHHQDERRWETDGCEVEVVGNTFTDSDQFAEFYLTRGSGSCSLSAAATSGADPDVTVSDFEFVISIPWTPP